MATAIHFGTDGWRGIIADDFTFANIESVAQATADVLLGEHARSIVVGNDRRFLATAHADRVGEILAGNGLSVIRLAGPAPTPAVSALVVDTGADAGVAVTASHNPPAFGGFKLKSRSGGSVSVDFTDAVEAALHRTAARRLAAPDAEARGLWRAMDFRAPYLARLGRRVDRERIAAAPPLTIVVDSMHGCGDDLVAAFLRDTPHRIITLRADADPLFGGGAPEPIPEHLTGLRDAVIAHRADIGLATDGDGDRMAAVDETGAFLSSLQISPLLADYLIRDRREPGGLAKTFANTLLLDRIAKEEGRPFHVFPIGFKHLVPLLESGELLLGGEESGGIGLAGYLPERDGVLIGLMLVELRAARARPLSDLLRDLWSRYGEFHYRRRDLRMPSSQGRAVAARLAAAPPASVAGLRVTGIDSLDGVKLLLGATGWVLVRPSGTEPVLRIYCEARTEEEVDRVLSEAAAWAKG